MCAAEDVVQDTFFRMLGEEFSNRTHLKSWLWKTATHLFIDASRRANTRNAYVGTWLPEPIETRNPEKDLVEIESLTMGFLLTLETLNETERAVLLLRDVSGFSSAETADIVKLSDANVRKMLSRSRSKLSSVRHTLPSIRYDRDVVRGKIIELVAAMKMGNAPLIVSLMSDDVVFNTDSGGRFVAIRRPIVGIEKVTRLFVALSQKYSETISMRLTHLNGWPGLVYEAVLESERIAPRGVILFAPNAEGEIDRIFQHLNPEKIDHLF